MSERCNQERTLLRHQSAITLHAARHRLIAAGLGVLALAPLAPLSGQGIVPCTHEARFGLVGMARLQTARLNVINLFPPDPFLPPDPFFPPDPILPPDPIVPPDPCHVAIGFLHPDGEPFVTAAGGPLIIERDLRPGESMVLELSSADAFFGSRLSRVPIRAAALLTHLPTPAEAPEPCGAIVPTLELYDAVTGRTQVFTHPSEIFEFNPQPEPPGDPTVSGS